MRMTLQTDYALRMLIYLAAHDPKPCTVNDVAASYGISHNHLLKIVPKLRDMGFVATARGRSGGIRLAVAPREINIGTVVRDLGEDFPVVECMKPGGRCPLFPVCRLKGVVNEALDAYLSAFDRYSLADLVTDRRELVSVFDAYKLAPHSAGRAA